MLRGHHILQLGPVESLQKVYGVGLVFSEALSQNFGGEPLTGGSTANIREFLGALSDEDAAARAIDDVPEAVPSGLPVGGWPN